MTKRPQARRFSRRWFLQGSAGAVAGGGAFAAMSRRRTALAQALPKVALSISTGATEFLWTVAKARRIDHKHGFDAQIDFIDPATANQGLFTGRIAVASSQPIPVAIANAAGKHYVLFAPALWNHNVGITAKDSRAAELKDLVGKKIATLPPLSGTYTSTQVIAAELGLNFQRDFQLVTGPPPAVLAFHARGDVDAIIHFEPFISNVLLAGRSKVFFESNQVWRRLTGSDMMLAGLAAEARWVMDNADLARRMTAALLEAGRLIRSDATVFDEHGKVIGLDTPEKIAIAKERLPQFYPTEWNAAVAANVRRIVERAAELGILAKPDKEFVVVV